MTLTPTTAYRNDAFARMQGGTRSQAVPLCVDLDGTLLKTDILWETFLNVITSSPGLVLACPFWLLRGRAHLKRELAIRARIRIDLLPIHRRIWSWVKRQENGGRKVLIVTGSDVIMAHLVANELQVSVIQLGSNGIVNLEGEAKARTLVSMFGRMGFDYIGNSNCDVPIWVNARVAIACNLKQSTIRRHPEIDFKEIWTSPPNCLLVLLKTLRPHQWAKNLFVFVPLAIVPSFIGIKLACIAFIAFSLSASTFYIFNDLTDIETDRIHVAKKHRPIASGDLPIIKAFVLFIVGVVIYIVMLLSLNGALKPCLLTYGVCSLFYSSKWKMIIVFDVIILGVLCSLRVAGGALAAGIVLPHWLLIISMLSFMSMALLKRYSELYRCKLLGRECARTYKVRDMRRIWNIGMLAVNSAILTAVLYIRQIASAAFRDQFLFVWAFIGLALYFTNRLWLLAARGGMNEDIIVFSIKDRNTKVVMSVAMFVWVASRIT